MDRFSTQQHIQALSMRNKDLFLEKMQAAAPIIEELAEVRPSTWRQMGGLFSSMEAVGRMNMLGNFTGRMQQVAMFPMNVMTQRVGFMLEGLMMPLMPVVNKAVMAYESYVMANQTGALIGGGIGLIVGSFLPGGPMVWGFIGTITGGIIESAIKSFKNPVSAKERMAPVFELLEQGWTVETWNEYYSGGGGTIVQDPVAYPTRTREEQWMVRISQKRLI